MKKIIISLISIVLLSSAFCPICAQSQNQTNLESITDQDLKFPSPKEAAQVFAKGKELLEIMERKSTIASPQPHLPPDLSKYGTYLPTLNYYEIIQSEVKEKHNNQYLKNYQNFYKQIVWKEDGIPDLTKAATIKAYLAFYNLIRNQGKPSGSQVGRIDEHFPLLGAHSEAFAKLQEQFGNNDAYLSFTFSISMVRGATTMIPKEDATQAEEIAKDILYHNLQKYGMTTEQIDEWLEFTTNVKNGKEILDETNNKGLIGLVSLENEWYYVLLLRSQDELLAIDDIEYVPFGLIALHEFQHVKDLFPGRKKDREDSLSELSTYVMEIVMSDNIYRQIHNIPDNQSVSYKHGDETINLGEIASLFRKLSKQYNTDNWAQLLLTPEATAYIKNVYDKQTEIVGRMALQNQYGISSDLLSKDKIRAVGKEVIHNVYLEDAFRDTNRTDKVIPY